MWKWPYGIGKMELAPSLLLAITKLVVSNHIFHAPLLWSDGGLCCNTPCRLLVRIQLVPVRVCFFREMLLGPMSQVWWTKTIELNSDHLISLEQHHYFCVKLVHSVTQALSCLTSRVCRYFCFITQYICVCVCAFKFKLLITYNAYILTLWYYVLPHLLLWGFLQRKLCSVQFGEKCISVIIAKIVLHTHTHTHRQTHIHNN